SSRLLQEEFPILRKQYWGRHFWAIGYGVWSTGVITDAMVQEYLNHHQDKPNSSDDTWVLEE
ncbi:MAG: transposase, partial [Bacteroidales bacterium]|nr:transposase [Bacteroidales bacterium]MBQ6276856.1 transposase [Bacteroidales bacterium]